MSPQLLMDVGPRLNPALSQWWTQPKDADDLVRWLGITDGMRVIEPSAGAGNIIRALPKGCVVTAVEIDDRWLPELAAAGAHLEHPIEIIHGDFFKVVERLVEEKRRFDAGVGNPPFEDGLDARFFRAAARVAARVGFITPLNCSVTKTRFEAAWRHLRVLRERRCVTRPAFGGEFGGGKRDIVMTEVEQRSTPRVEGEEDLVRVGWRP